MKTLSRKNRRARVKLSRKGFTLIELSIVLQVLGLIAIIGYSNVVRFAERAKLASCVANQRTIHEVSILYGMESSPGTGNVNVNALTAGGLLQKRAGECPSSANGSFNDYTLLFINDQLSLIQCDVKGALHPYVP